MTLAKIYDVFMKSLKVALGIEQRGQCLDTKAAAPANFRAALNHRRCSLGGQGQKMT